MCTVCSSAYVQKGKPRDFFSARLHFLNSVNTRFLRLNFRLKITQLLRSVVNVCCAQISEKDYFLSIMVFAEMWHESTRYLKLLFVIGSFVLKLLTFLQQSVFKEQIVFREFPHFDLSHSKDSKKNAISNTFIKCNKLDLLKNEISKTSTYLFLEVTNASFFKILLKNNHKHSARMVYR